MAPPPRIFLSSTWQDLQAERDSVEKALHRMKDTAFNGMEYFGSCDDDAHTVSLDEVDRSQFYDDLLEPPDPPIFPTEMGDDVLPLPEEGAPPSSAPSFGFTDERMRTTRTTDTRSRDFTT